MFEQARLEQMNEQMNEHIIQNQINENDIHESDNNNNSAPQNIDELLKNSEKDEINFDQKKKFYNRKIITNFFFYDF